MSNPIIIAVTNRKGGTGKTTTAVNLAAGSAASGQRTLLIDLDTQGHCAIGLGVEASKQAPSIHRLFGASAVIALADTIVQTRWERLDLIPADCGFQHDQGPGDDRRLADALADAAIARTYDVVLIDTPPSLDHLLLNALTAAHAAIIPFVPHPLAAEGVRQLARLFFKVAMSSNADLRLQGLLPIMYDARIGQHRRVREQILRQYGAERLLPGIRCDIKLAESFAAGTPIRVYAPRSRGAEDYGKALERLDLVSRRLSSAS